MKPQWFKIADIPFDQMWPDDILWMPRVFKGEFVKGSFMFDKDQKISEYYFE